MKFNSLHEVFVEELKDLYDAEKRLVKALPKMMKAASSGELSTAISDHLEETQGHVQRLEQVFDNLGVSPGRKKCDAMHGLLEEGSKLTKEDGDPTAKDAAMICAAQKVEHYEIASYRSVRTWAQILGNDVVAQLLQETLDEEGSADKKLTDIAKSLDLRQARRTTARRASQGTRG